MMKRDYKRSQGFSKGKQIDNIINSFVLLLRIESYDTLSSKLSLQPPGRRSHCGHPGYRRTDLY